MFESEHLHLLRSRSDEYNAMLATGTGEIRIFTQEAVAGMNRLSTCFERCLQDQLCIQITRLRWPLTDQNCLVGPIHM
ncbi:hypothetical protein D3C86_2070720 [compost metagenome]